MKIDLRNLGGKKVKKDETIIRCEECRGSINIEVKEVTYNTNSRIGKLGVTYFKCNHCDKIYLITVKDNIYADYIRKNLQLQKLFYTVIRKADNKRTIELTKELNNRLEENKEKIMKHEANLRDMYQEEILNHIREK